MPVIVVTRLRLRDPALLTAFFTAGAAVLRQAKKADGNLGADALGDAKQRGTMNAVTSGDPGPRTCSPCPGSMMTARRQRCLASPNPPREGPSS
jgi:hypothetical protein